MLQLSDDDRAMLNGDRGPAPRLAMSILVRMADVYGAAELMDISQAHIDSTIYLGDATLDFAERLAALGARVAVPTSLNVSGVDECGWKDWAVPPDWAAKAARQMLAYEKMGAVPMWTCAPYQTHMRPAFGQQIAWGESNAIAFANSVIGARTERYPDLLDVCCAITGRVPAVGLHLTAQRARQMPLRGAAGHRDHDCGSPCSTSRVDDRRRPATGHGDSRQPALLARRVLAARAAGRRPAGASAREVSGHVQPPDEGARGGKRSPRADRGVWRADYARHLHPGVADAAAGDQDADDQLGEVRLLCAEPPEHARDVRQPGGLRALGGRGSRRARRVAVADRVVAVRAIVAGNAEGDALVTSDALSFRGGYDFHTGEIIDRHHPLAGTRAAGRILAVPF